MVVCFCFHSSHNSFYTCLFITTVSWHFLIALFSFHPRSIISLPYSVFNFHKHFYAFYVNWRTSSYVEVLSIYLCVCNLIPVPEPFYRFSWNSIQETFTNTSRQFPFSAILIYVAKSISKLQNWRGVLHVWKRHLRLSPLDGSSSPMAIDDIRGPDGHCLRLFLYWQISFSE
jgi:hypothetical protein